MAPPRFSIVTVCYNPGAAIEQCLRSVMAQQGAAIEHLVIDGASSDGTPERISGWDWWHGTLVSERDAGIYDAMNKGLARASGDYIGFLNADDWLTASDSIARLAAAAAEMQPEALAGDVIIVDPDRPGRQRYYSGAGDWAAKLRWGQMPPHPGFYMRADVLRALGGFATDYRIAADYDLMLRHFCVKKGAALHVPVPVVTMATGGVSNQGWQSRVTINREIARACARHGVSTNAFMIWSKYLTKIWQYLPRRSA